ncbi:MAG: restriction endonuclease subunit S [Zoogloeaceae bacterium]|jgi:type I restriction enzyme S subunit|nr:restriction endonuclease subunit S [Zoogloeaceae bacterium]
MKLCEVADIVAGFAFPEVHQGRDNLPTPFIKVSDFARAQESYIFSAVNTVDDGLLKLMRAKPYPPGTVIFPKVGGALLTNKRARLGVSATFDNNVMGLIPRTIDGDYLYWFMCQFDMAQLANTQALPSVRASDVAQIEIPVPSLCQQRQIAARLKAQLAEVETARQAAEAQVREADLLRRRVLQTSVDNTGGEGESAWGMSNFVRLGDCTTKIGSGQTPLGGYRAYTDNGIPLIRSQNVLMGSFTTEGLANIPTQIDEEMRGSRVARHDVLLNITGASIGRVCVVPDDICPANVNQHVCIIRCGEKLHPDYVMLVLSSPSFQSLIWRDQAGATRQALTKDMIENFRIPWVSLPKQRQIAARLKAQLAEADTLRAALSEQRRELDALPQRILAQAFDIKGVASS